MNTTIEHRACGTEIFLVRGGLRPGDPVPPASAFEPLGDWPKPTAGDRTICPSCGAGFLMNDLDLKRSDVE